MNKRSYLSILLVCLPVLLLTQIVRAQQPSSNPQADERFKADILVIVAHPDDESMIAGYLAKETLDEHKRVAVVIATRGNAGQNLVGYEQDHSLAEIREMEARQAVASIGIHNIWFLRAPDTPSPAGEIFDVTRSLETWNHGKVLGEMARFIRLTRPKIVITMLPDVVVGENHQDHQAAGVIATEAFDLAGDPTQFPEQVTTPDDRLWFGNKMEGLHPWQPQKLYYFTDATQRDFLNGSGPEYSMTDTSPSQDVSYARLAAKEKSYHKTQYGDRPSQALKTGNLDRFERPLGFVLGKSLVGGSVTGDIFQGVVSHPIPFVPVQGYRPPERLPDYSLELGGAWAFYKQFWPAHNLDSMTGLLSPQVGVSEGQDFPIPLLLHNNTDHAVTFHLNTQFPKGWAIDSTATQSQYIHHPMRVHTFEVDANGDYPVRIRLTAPQLDQSQWQKIIWSAEADGQSVGLATLNAYVRAN